MEIPEQLIKERFIRANQEKAPIENGWPTKANYSYEGFKPGKIYGVLCGNNNLIVIDCDKKRIQDKFMQIEQIRNTFIVQTAGKGLYHFYFHVSHTTKPKEEKNRR